LTLDEILNVVKYPLQYWEEETTELGRKSNSISHGNSFQAVYAGDGSEQIKRM